MFKERFRRFTGLNSYDYKLLDLMLEKYPECGSFHYLDLVYYSHKKDELDPKKQVEPNLMVFRVKRGDREYILKIKRCHGAENEYEIQKRAYEICPEGVIKPYSAGELKYRRSRYQFILMDEGKDICELTKENKRKVVKLFVQFLRCMKKLRKGKVLHRDIKLGNMVLHDGRIKLIDFDFAIMDCTESSAIMTAVHSGFYTAPEIILTCKDHKAHYGNRSMLFSAGLCLYLLLNELERPGGDDAFELADQYDIHEHSSKFTAPLTRMKDDELSRILCKARAYHKNQRYRDEDHFIADLNKWLGVKSKKNTGGKEFWKGVRTTFLVMFVVTCLAGTALKGVPFILDGLKQVSIEKSMPDSENVISSTEDHLEMLKMCEGSEEVKKYLEEKNLPHRFLYSVGKQKKGSEIEVAEISYDGKSYVIEEIIHNREGEPESFKFSVPKNAYKNKKGHISMQSPLDLSGLGFPMDQMSQSDVSYDVKELGDNVVSKDYILDMNQRKLLFNSLVVKGQKTVMFELCFYQGENTLYTKQIHLQFK